MPDQYGLPTAGELRKSSQHGIATAPRTYASQQRDKILANWQAIEHSLQERESLSSTLRRLEIDKGTFYDFLEDSPAHGNRYSRACAIRADAWHEKAEEATDSLLNGQGDPNGIRTALNGIAWITKVLEPKKYGDHKHIALDVTHKVDASELGDDQLALVVRPAVKALDAEYREVPRDGAEPPPDDAKRG